MLKIYKSVLMYRTNMRKKFELFCIQIILFNKAILSTKRQRLQFNQPLINYIIIIIIEYYSKKLEKKSRSYA